MRGQPRTRQPISVRESLEEIVDQGFIMIMDQRRRRIQHKPGRCFHDGEVEVVYRRRLGRIPTAQRSSRTRSDVVEAREALHVLRQPVVWPGALQIHVLRLRPQEPGPPRAEQELVARADDKVCPQTAYVHRYGAARLTYIENQQRSIPLARRGKR